MGQRIPGRLTSSEFAAPDGAANHPPARNGLFYPAGVRYTGTMSRQTPRNRCGHLLASLAIVASMLMSAADSEAVESLSTQVGRAQFGDLVLREFAASLQLTATTPRAEVRVAAVRWQDLEIGPVTLVCQELTQVGPRVHCRQASARVELPQGGVWTLQGNASMNRGTGSASLALAGEHEGDPVRIRLRHGVAGGHLEVELPAVPVGWLTSLPGLSDWSASGRAAASLRAETDGLGRIQGNATLHLEEVTAASGDGSLATESFDGTAAVALRGDQSEQQATLSLQARAGVVYADPVLVDLDAQPVDLAASLTHAGDRTWLERLRVNQPGVIEASGHGRLDWGHDRPLQRLSMEISELALPAGFDAYLQPFVIGTTLDSVAAEGRAAGELSLRDGEAEYATLELDGVTLTDRRQRFHVEGLNGDLRWRRSGEAPHSRLQWQRARIYGIPLGTAAAELSLSGHEVALRRPLELPVADGQLALERLEATGVGGDGLRVTLAGQLGAVSLQQLGIGSRWLPPGTLAGQIPPVTYDDGELSLDGVLRADLFGGTATVPRLRLSDPLGRLPRLRADLQLRGLDLEQVTQTYDVGRMTGPLNADITGLELVGWEPVAMDAHLYTPPETTATRRISQQAIQTISDLGGGSGALVSGTLLRLFENFRYDRLGIRCRLRDDECRMSGVAPAPEGGYYLVRGAGVPRVDVIGYNERVDWSALLEQLRAAVAGAGDG